METTIVTTNIAQQQTTSAQRRAQQVRKPLRAESVVKVTKDYAALIRASGIKDEFKDSDHQDQLLFSTQNFVGFGQQNFARHFGDYKK